MSKTTNFINIKLLPSQLQDSIQKFLSTHNTSNKYDNYVYSFDGNNTFGCSYYAKSGKYLFVMLDKSGRILGDGISSVWSNNICSPEPIFRQGVNNRYYLSPNKNQLYNIIDAKQGIYALKNINLPHPRWDSCVSWVNLFYNKTLDYHICNLDEQDNHITKIRNVSFADNATIQCVELGRHKMVVVYRALSGDFRMDYIRVGHAPVNVLNNMIGCYIDESNKNELQIKYKDEYNKPRIQILQTLLEHRRVK